MFHVNTTDSLGHESKLKRGEKDHTKYAFWVDFWHFLKQQTKKTPWPLARKRTIPTDRRLSAKLVSTFADGGYRVVSATDPHGR
jgi:hypothetical protein